MKDVIPFSKVFIIIDTYTFYCIDVKKPESNASNENIKDIEASYLLHPIKG